MPDWPPEIDVEPTMSVKFKGRELSYPTGEETEYTLGMKETPWLVRTMKEFFNHDQWWFADVPDHGRYGFDLTYESPKPDWEHDRMLSGIAQFNGAANPHGLIAIRTYRRGQGHLFVSAYYEDGERVNFAGHKLEM